MGLINPPADFPFYATRNTHYVFRMPSFDIVSQVNSMEIENGVNQAKKELATRFDFKDAKTDIVHEKDKIVLTADDATHLKGLREIVIGKLSKRAVDLRNIKQEDAAIFRIPLSPAPQLFLGSRNCDATRAQASRLAA